MTVWDAPEHLEALAATQDYQKAMAPLARLVVGTPAVSAMECAVAIAAQADAKPPGQLDPYVQLDP